MKKQFIQLLLWATFATVQAQTNQNFNNPNFTFHPQWLGDTTNFTVANNKLQSASTTANSSFYITTPSQLVQNTLWEWWVQLAFNTSSTNYVDIFLIADSNNLLQANNGYFVRMGGTTDEISLYKLQTGVATKIADGTDGVLNSSNNILKVKVTCDTSGVWSVYTDPTASGNNYTLQNTVLDTSVNTKGYFGIRIRQSTASFFSKHFFDDIQAYPLFLDTIAPELIQAEAPSASTVELLFSEDIDSLSATNTLNYFADNGLGTPTAAQWSLAAPSKVVLHYNMPMQSARVYNFTAIGIKDKAGNTADTIRFAVQYISLKTPVWGDLLITEIMPKPDPVVGLPNEEYVELYNRSQHYIKTAGCRFADASSSVVIPDVVIPPDSFVILCRQSAQHLFVPYGRVLALSTLPSLNNTDDVLLLLNASNEPIHRVAYHESWFGTELKKIGGWSLEMVDANNECAGANNWKASVAALGGTPGKPNSVKAANPDNRYPICNTVYATNDSTLEFRYNEPMDSSYFASVFSDIIIKNSAIVPKRFVACNADRSSFRVVFAPAFIKGVRYEAIMPSAKDCYGNKSNFNRVLAFGLPDSVAVGDIIINEILFNPKSDGVDFVEIYNRSNKVIDLKELLLANGNDNGLPSAIVFVAPQGYQLAPGAYLVLSADKNKIYPYYTIRDSIAFLDLTSMPSYNIDQGHVFLLTRHGAMVDSFSYTDNMHHELLDDVKGISLERISIKGNSNDPQNWQSAAEGAGFATPGYQNSNHVTGKAIGEKHFVLATKTFSPDSDGADDYLQLDYQLPGSFMVSVRISDANGVFVKQLCNNLILAGNGFLLWDGTNEKGAMCPIGIYIVTVEAFDTSGKTVLEKYSCVLAAKI